MYRLVCFVVLLTGCWAFSLLDTREYFHGGGSMIQWEPRTMISSASFPCPSEGFYMHPSNCSRFYRCVDFTNESLIFSRYLFECPAGNVYASSISTCVPGVCPQLIGEITDGAEAAEAVSGTAEAAGTAVNGADSSATDSAAVDSSASEAASGVTDSVGAVDSATDSAGSVDSTVDEAGSTDAVDGTAGQEPAGTDTGSAVDSSSTDAAATDGADTAGSTDVGSNLPPVASQTGPDGVNPSEAGVEDCKYPFNQHERFCNLYHRCNETDSLFSCVEGTAFSEENNMCRLILADPSMCEGKKVFVPSSSIFRDAFNWKEVGVLPYLDNPILNSNPFIFTNIESMKAEGKYLPNSSLRFRSYPSSSLQNQNNVFPESQGVGFQSFFDVYNTRPIPDYRSTEHDFASPSVDQNDVNVYHGLESAAAYAYPHYPYGMEEAIPVGYRSGEEGVLVSVPNPYYDPQSDYSPDTQSALDYFSYLARSISPFVTPNYSTQEHFPYGYYPTQAFAQPETADATTGQYKTTLNKLRDQSSNIFASLRGGQQSFPYQNYEQVSGQRYAPFPTRSQFSSYPSTYPFFGFTSPLLRYFPSTFSSSSSYPSYFNSQIQSNFPFSPLPQDPTYGQSFSPLSFGQGYQFVSPHVGSSNTYSPYTSSPYFTPTYSTQQYINPYSQKSPQTEVEKAKDESLTAAEFLKFLNTFSTKTKDTSQKDIPYSYEFKLNKIQPFSASEGDSEAFSARTEGDTYHIIPVSDEHIDELQQSGLLGDVGVLTRDIDFEDIRDMEDGQVILATLPEYKK